MNYKETIDFLFTQVPMFQRIGSGAYKPGLQNALALDNIFGNAHCSFRTIHVFTLRRICSTSANESA